jgi:hypothetical protein
LKQKNNVLQFFAEHGQAFKSVKERAAEYAQMMHKYAPEIAGQNAGALISKKIPIFLS